MKTKTVKKSPQDLLDNLGYTQYTDKEVVAIMPENTDDTPIEFFILGKCISDDDLELEYDKRELQAVNPRYIIEFLKENKDVLDEKKYIGTHWKDAKGKWCFAAFNRWSDERRVRVDRNDYDWYVDWWFAGVRKSSELAPQYSLDTMSLELSEAIEIVKKSGYRVMKEL